MSNAYITFDATLNSNSVELLRYHAAQQMAKNTKANADKFLVQPGKAALQFASVFTKTLFK